MANDSTMPSEDLSDFLPQQPNPEAPTKRDFKAWHKPRKQYIRRKQWGKEIEKLIKASHFSPENRVFRYLTLPSEDMLDIRLLESSLVNSQLKLKYLGFFNAPPGHPDDIRMNLSEAEIKGLKQVDATSEVVRDLLETTGNNNSFAFRKMSEHAPYHAVNIDLCGHFAAPRGGRAKACIDAIRSIAEVQVQRSTQGWLLFLTTRFQPDYVDGGHLKSFVAAIRENIDKSEAFADSLGELFAKQGDQLIQKLDSAEGMSISEFRSFFCIGFGKWLLAFLTGATPKTKVEMLPSYYYSIHEGEHEMLSLAFKCSPNIVLPTDRFDLAPAPARADPEVVDEVELAIKLARSTTELTDLDALLEQAPDQMEKMIIDTIRFLQQASYDTTDYRNFASNGVAA